MNTAGETLFFYWIPAFAGMAANKRSLVMPAQAGIQSSKAPLCGTLFYWIPASAGMTAKGHSPE